MRIFDKLVVWSLPLVPKPIVGYFSKIYIAGSKLEDAVRVIKELNTNGMMATMDLLGEESKEVEKSAQAADEYIKILKAIHDEKID